MSAAAGIAADSVEIAKNISALKRAELFLNELL